MMQITIDIKKQRATVFVIEEVIDLKYIYSRVKETFDDNDDTKRGSFPFQMVGATLMLNPGWTMALNGHEFEDRAMLHPEGFRHA